MEITMPNRLDPQADTRMSHPPLTPAASAGEHAVHGIRIPHEQLPHGSSGSGGCSVCTLDKVSWSLSVELMGEARVDSVDLFVEIDPDAGDGLDFSLTSEQVALLNEARAMTLALASQHRGDASRAWVRTVVAGVLTDTKIEILGA